MRTSSDDAFRGIAIELPASGWVAKSLSTNSVTTVEVDKLFSDSNTSSATLKLCAKVGDGAIGEISQVVDGAYLRGKTVVLHARISTTLSTTVQSDHVTLLVGANGESRSLYPWMRTRVPATSQWINAVVPFRVPGDATELEVKLLQVAPGVSSISGVTLETVDARLIGWEPPKPLTARGLSNLHAFARLLGYVRFFHPSDQAAVANWNDIAIAGVQHVENAPNALVLMRALRKVFLPIAPTLRIYRTGGVAPARSYALLGSPNAKIIGWVHHGVAIDGRNDSSVFFDKRIEMKAPKPKEAFSADLGGDVSILMPTTLYQDHAGTLPHVKLPPIRPDKPALFAPTGLDRTTRLADVILSWNVFQNFYPDFDEVPGDWDSVLDAALKKAATDRDETEFLDTLYEEVAALRDGHADAFNLRQNLLLLPLFWDWIDGQLVVLNTGPSIKQLRPGDVIDKIDHRPVADVIAEWLPKVSAATPQSKQVKALIRMLSATSASAVDFEGHAPDGRKVFEQVEPAENAVSWNQFDSLEPVTELKPNIWYVDLRRIGNAELDASMTSLQNAKFIIIDVRGYPSDDAIDFMAHLSSKPIATGQFDRPVITLPDRLDVTYDHLGWVLPPRPPTFTGKFIFLTNAWAISQSETIMGMVANNHLGLIIGSATAGTDGTQNSFTMPGEYSLTWTDIRVRNLNGSRFQGVGIIPNIQASPTVAGIAGGRDEVLERALTVAEGQLLSSPTKN